MQPCSQPVQGRIDNGTLRCGGGVRWFILHVWGVVQNHPSRFVFVVILKICLFFPREQSQIEEEEERLLETDTQIVPNFLSDLCDPSKVILQQNQ